MDTRQRQRNVYPTGKQKKKLMQLLMKHPELISCKVSQDFNYSDSQRLWYNIATECNALPGAKKTWRQWRKTWQDIRCKAKKQGQLPSSVTMLTSAEQETLGLKKESSTTNYQDMTEFIPIGEDGVLDTSTFDNEMDSGPLRDAVESLSEPEITESLPEEKVFTCSGNGSKKNKPSKNPDSEHSDRCLFNCDMMARQEYKKFQMKRDYYNFKKDYLSQKLLLMKEQNEALKNIAKELAK